MVWSSAMAAICVGGRGCHPLVDVILYAARPTLTLFEFQTGLRNADLRIAEKSPSTGPWRNPSPRLYGLVSRDCSMSDMFSK
jgi:hypothetical protein